MTWSDAHEFVAALLSGRLSVAEAGHELVADKSLARRIDVALRALPASDRVRLDAVMPAVSWEMTKLLSEGRIPDVPFGSPEHRAIVTSPPPVRRPGGP